MLSRIALLAFLLMGCGDDDGSTDGGEHDGSPLDGSDDARDEDADERDGASLDANDDGASEDGSSSDGSSSDGSSSDGSSSDGSSDGSADGSSSDGSVTDSSLDAVPADSSSSDASDGSPADGSSSDGGADGSADGAIGTGGECSTDEVTFLDADEGEVALYEIGAACLETCGLDLECGRACVAEAMAARDVGAECAECATERLACVYTTCNGPCVEPTSEECLLCQCQHGCIERYDACAGTTRVTHCETVDFCTAEQAEILGSGSTDVELGMLAESCLATCSTDIDCFRSCVTEGVGTTALGDTECTSCIVNRYVCAGISCPTCLEDVSSEACFACQCERGCIAEYDDCSGVEFTELCD